MRACMTGNGLPYHVRHPKAVEVQDVSRWCRYATGIRRCGCATFESQLRRAREALLPEIKKRAENFDVEKLEWFTIFVSVKDWKLRALRKTSEDVDVEPGISGQPSEDNQKEFDCENDTPV